MTKEQKYPLMPKATAVWLIDNTALTFKQIADFCGIHELEVQGIADGEVSSGFIGTDPVAAGQLTKEEIERCTKDPSARLRLLVSKVYDEVNSKKKKKTKYIPIARRQDKPNAAYWLIKNVPGIKDSDIIKLIATTKNTVATIRDRSHWNIQNIVAKDPVFLGICSQADLDKIIENSKEVSPDHGNEDLNNEQDSTE